MTYQQNQIIFIRQDNISSILVENTTEANVEFEYSTTKLGDEMPSFSSSLSTVVSQSQFIELLKLCEFQAGRQLKLIYRASRDGFSSAAFHSKCDSSSAPSLTLVKTWPHGFIFGGYTEAEWDGHSGYKIDYNAFLISLVNKYDEPHKLPIKRGNSGAYEMFAIYANARVGPAFGDAYENSVTSYLDKDCEFDLFIADQSNSNNNSYTKLVDVNYKNGRIPQYVMPYHFQTLDVEVYQLL